MSNISIGSNRCYIVKGTLNIDQDESWYQVQFLMDEKSKIFVETGNKLEINDCYLSGCDHMWQGIETETSSTLRIYNSFIESANLGVKLADETSFQCAYNDFIDNFVGISVGSPFESDQFEQHINQRAQIVGCDFFTDNAVPDPYSGHHYYPSWPSTPSQIPYNQGFAAIFISGSNGLNLGYNGATGSYVNNIYNMRNGIVSRNSVMIIQGTDFHDFEGTMVNDPPDEKLDINQHAIHSFRSVLNVRDVTVNDVMVGAYSEESNTTFLENTISILNTGQDLVLTRGLSAKFPQGFVAEDNEINEGYHGISLENVNSPISIGQNEFDRNITLRHNAGINIRFLRYLDNEEGLISGNTINVNDGQAASGIALADVHFLTVEDNDINFNRVNIGGPWKFNSGIQGAALSGSIIRWNDIVAHSSYESLEGNFGMAYTDGAANSFYCNSIDHWDRLIRYTGPCFMTNLTGTDFNNGFIGLELIGPTMLGPQRHNGNEWQGNYTSFGAFIGGTQPLVTASSSTFFADASDAAAGILIPANIGPLAVVGTWFVDQTGQAPTCETSGGDIELEPDTLANLILNGLSFSDYNDQMEWILKANIYDLILSDSTLTDNSTLDSFFTVESSTPLGKLVQADHNLNLAFDSYPDKKESYFDSIASLSNDILYIDSLLALNPSDSTTQIALRELKVDSLSERLRSWIELVDDEKSASEDEYEDIRDSLSVLTARDDLEEHYQDALIFKADLILGDSFSTSDSSDVVDLSELCPWEGGRAISIAKGILTNLIDSTMKNKYYTCSPPSPFIGSPEIETGITEGHELSIYPNPANNELNIESNNIIERAEIRTLNNTVFKTFFPNSNKFEIDISSYPSGMYFVVAKSESTFEIHRIIIVKQ